MKKVLSVFITIIILSGCTLLNKPETHTVAHRGATTRAPENTLEAINEAANYGYYGVEIDVRCSKDGVPFLMHDDTLDRTTTGTGIDENYTLAELKKLKIKTDAYNRYKDKNLKIPTFDEAAETIAENNLIVNVDGSKGNWKDDVFVSNIINTLKKHNIYDKSFFVLTDENTRDRFSKKHPDATVSWLYDGKTDINKEIRKIKKYNSALLSVSDTQATDNVLKKLTESKINYQVYGVNEKKRFIDLKNKRVPIIETDKIEPINIK
ncbi:TPA: glycerophosphodiester phosphodiesterase family protein [Enterococcus faecalis]|nr:glycerophosphodiester phosphodiesterase family protein [Enterococcus faecalis]